MIINEVVENRSKPMGAPRKDRDIDYWIEHGGRLFEILTPRRSLYKDMKPDFDLLMTSLKGSTVEGALAIDIQTLIDNLNGYKYELGDFWGLWLSRSNQTIKDEKRKKVYISDSSYNKIKEYSSKSGLLKEDNANHKQKDENIKISRSLELLFDVMGQVGIFNISDLYDLNERLESYSDCFLANLKDKEFHDASMHKDETTFSIIKSIIDLLRENKISTYEGLGELLATQKNNKNKIKRNEEKIITLKDKLSKAYAEISELEKTKKDYDFTIATLENDMDMLMEENNMLKQDKHKQIKY